MVFVVDGMQAVEACYHFAGITGHDPHRYSLRELWWMANGNAYQKRTELIQLTSVIWGAGEIDIERFIRFGSLDANGKGGPVQLSDEMQARVDAEVQRIRETNSNLPKFKVSQ